MLQDLCWWIRTQISNLLSAKQCSKIEREHSSPSRRETHTDMKCTSCRWSMWFHLHTQFLSFTHAQLEMIQTKAGQEEPLLVPLAAFKIRVSLNDFLGGSCNICWCLYGPTLTLITSQQHWLLAWKWITREQQKAEKTLWLSRQNICIMWMNNWAVALVMKWLALRQKLLRLESEQREHLETHAGFCKRHFTTNTKTSHSCFPKQQAGLRWLMIHYN